VKVRGAAIAVLGGLAASSVLWAATIETLDVTRKQARYELAANAHLDATPESICAVLTDYADNAFGRISSAYKESRFLDPAPDGTPIVSTRMKAACCSIA
jgi:hypothetical protein